MRNASARRWRWCVSVVVWVALLVGVPLTASAHPSDFQTLTIDLIFGADGLETIDAAVVESSGPSYGPFPSSEWRQRVAEDVLDAMGLSGFPLSIDSELSERYHEVGFYIVFAEPVSIDGLLRVETGSIQQIAREANLGTLKLSVCSDSPEIFSQLEIDATSPGRGPTNPAERAPCEIWDIPVDDQPVAVTVTFRMLPMTGITAHPTLLAALVLLAIGSVLLFPGRLESSADQGDSN